MKELSPDRTLLATKFHVLELLGDLERIPDFIQYVQKPDFPRELLSEGIVREKARATQLGLGKLIALLKAAQNNRQKQDADPLEVESDSSAEHLEGDEAQKLKIRRRALVKRIENEKVQMLEISRRLLDSTFGGLNVPVINFELLNRKLNQAQLERIERLSLDTKITVYRSIAHWLEEDERRQFNDGILDLLIERVQGEEKSGLHTVPRKKKLAQEDAVIPTQALKDAIKKYDQDQELSRKKSEKEK